MYIRLSMLLLIANVHAGIIIDLAPEAVVNQEFVKLIEVAELRGEMAKTAGNVFVSQSPRHGEILTLTRKNIETRLRDLGINVPIQFEGSENVHITRTTNIAPSSVKKIQPNAQFSTLHTSNQIGIRNNTIRSKDAANITKILIAKTYSEAIKNADILAATYQQHPDLIVDVIVTTLDFVSEDAVSVEPLEMQGNPLGELVLAYRLFDFSKQELGTGIARLSSSLKVPRFVVQRWISEGTVITRVELKETLFNIRDAVPFLPIEAIEGKIAARSLQPNVPLLLSDLREQPAVRKDQIVHSITRVGNCEIREIVKATANGKIGDMILVQPRDHKTGQFNGKGYIAYVVEPGKVMSVLGDIPTK